MRSTTGTTGEDEDYIVRLASGDVRAMTLEQLDEAFCEGRVAAATPIVAPGGTEWSTLADLANLEPDDEPASLVPVVRAPSAAPDDVEIHRIVPRATPLLTIAIVAFVFAALGTVAVITLRGRGGAASAQSAAGSVERATRADPVAPPAAPVTAARVPEPSAAPPPTGTTDAKRTNATGSPDRKRKARPRRK